MVWPGSNVFFKDGFYFRFYVGDGLKYDPKPYFPSFMDTIKSDLEDPELIFEQKAQEKNVIEEKLQNSDAELDE